MTGADPGIGEDRTFRLDRIADARTLPGSFEPPAGFDPAQHVLSGLAKTPYRHEVTLSIQGTIEQIRARLPASVATVEELPGGRRRPGRPNAGSASNCTPNGSTGCPRCSPRSTGRSSSSGQTNSATSSPPSPAGSRPPPGGSRPANNPDVLVVPDRQPQLTQLSGSRARADGCGRAVPADPPGEDLTPHGIATLGRCRTNRTTIRAGHWTTMSITPARRISAAMRAVIHRRPRRCLTAARLPSSPRQSYPARWARGAAADRIGSPQPTIGKTGRVFRDGPGGSARSAPR